MSFKVGDKVIFNEKGYDIYTGIVVDTNNLGNYPIKVKFSRLDTHITFTNDGRRYVGFPISLTLCSKLHEVLS